MINCANTIAIIMVYSWYEKRRILYYYQHGILLPTRATKTSQAGVAKFIKKFKLTGSIARTPGSGRPSKITAEIKKIVEEKMRKQQQRQLHALLVGMDILKRTILCCCTVLGWTFRGNVCCQLIREVNKVK